MVRGGLIPWKGRNGSRLGNCPGQGVCPTAQQGVPPSRELGSAGPASCTALESCAVSRRASSAELPPPAGGSGSDKAEAGACSQEHFCRGSCHGEGQWGSCPRPRAQASWPPREPPGPSRGPCLGRASPRVCPCPFLPLCLERMVPRSVHVDAKCRC